MTIQTYTQKSNATRAAVRALKKKGIVNPKLNDDFEIKPVQENFIWIQSLTEDLTTEDHAPVLIKDQTGMPIFSRRNLKGAVKECSLPVAKSKTKIQKNRLEQNGVKRPSEGTICNRIWNHCEALQLSKKGKVPSYQDLKNWAVEANVDKTTCKVQYYRWRTFCGISGRV